jgi:hypothetical protein
MPCCLSSATNELERCQSLNFKSSSVLQQTALRNNHCHKSAIVSFFCGHLSRFVFFTPLLSCMGNGGLAALADDILASHPNQQLCTVSISYGGG